MRGSISLPDLVIPNGAAVSNAYDQAGLTDAIGITVCADAGNAGDTFEWQVSLDNSTWFDLMDAAAVLVKVPAAGKALTYLVSEFGAGLYYRIKDNTGNASGAQTFKVMKQFEY